ncbi:hypothetical protein CCAX7_000850 [Capsulimonas corticalis]|uniref:Uncharacterized protein n=2 Tax=Capsulimonas corticalis TaxID=2219043 RepID=A0A402CRJ1_9BACT|nr:hypothetical protein CCAX7_000850 [Capsulimonas corticalis]
MTVLPALWIFSICAAHADPAGASKHELALHAAPPQSVIDTMHWSKPENLPEGVASITASGSSLVVVGTDAGFARVQEIAPFVDVPVRKVALRVQFVSAKSWDVTASGVSFALLGPAPDKKAAPTIMAGVDTRIQQASGPAVAKLQTALAKSGGSLKTSTVTAVNNTEVSASVGSAPKLPLLAGCAFFITPRVNEDNSVTLFLRPVVTTRSAGSAQKEETQETKLIGKVQSGQPVVIGNLARSGNRASDAELLVFITPAIAENKS